MKALERELIHSEGQAVRSFLVVWLEQPRIPFLRKEFDIALPQVMSGLQRPED